LRADICFITILAVVQKFWLQRKQLGNLEISTPETTSDTSELGLAGNKQMNFRLGDTARCHNCSDGFSSKVIRETTTNRDVI
jgi:hypothetical protein